MAFAVSKWGYSPDPRPPDFCPTGFDFGAFTAWRWVSSTTDADSPYQNLNDRHVWECTSFTIDGATWEPTVPIPGAIPAVLSVGGTNLPAGGPPTFTIRWRVLLRTSFDPDVSIGFVEETYPNALQTRSFSMSGSGTGGPFFPNPLVMTPHKWNAD